MSGPGAPGPAAADPHAAIAKYDAITQAGSDKDAAIITRVEAQLANSPMGWLQGLLGEASSKGESEKGEAQGKVEEMKDEVSKNEKDAPPDAGTPPKPGQASHPAVNTPASAKGGDKGAPGKKAGDAGKAKPPGKGGGQKPATKGAASPGGDGGGGAVAALAAGDGDINAALDAYEPKAPGTKDTIAKIKQMGDVAKGFSGQIDTYVGTAGDGINGALARAGNWIGEGKNVAAIWENNPYKKAEGFLGTIMKVLSAIKSVAAVVGSICGKIGMILTVVGLLGMIFPPIGAAVSAVARILNIVGLICDVISFALSGVLTGLNGVRLAQLAASGASPEEKAACADLMMSEANDCAGSVISLAMQFGPKFMKGMLGKSKGILNGLMKRAKAVLGNLAAKVGGNVKNFVSKVLTKFGVGVKGRIVGGVWQAEKGAIKKVAEGVTNFAKKTGTKIKDTVVNSGVYKKAASTAGKVWKAGGDVVDKIKASPVGKKVGQAADFVKKKGGEFSDSSKKKVNQFNDSAFAKKLDTFAAKTNKFGDKIDLEMKVEKMGETLGGVGADWNMTKGLNKGTDVIENQTKQYKEQLAKAEAENLATAREKYMRDQAAAKNAEYKNMKADGANLEDRSKPWKESNRLNEEADQVGALTKKDAKATYDAGEKAAKDAEKQAAATEAQAADAVAERNKNPDAYADKAQKARIKRREMEENFQVDDAERKRISGLGAEATDAEKKQLETLNAKLKGLDEVRKQDDLYYKTLGGAEKTKAPEGVVETAKFGHEQFKKGREAWDTWVHPGEDGPKDRAKSWESAETFDFKNPLKWDKAGAKDNADKRTTAESKAQGGAPALTMPDEKAEFHEFVAKRQEGASIASSVKNILSRIKKKDPSANAKAPTNAGPKPVAKEPGQTPDTQPNAPSNAKSNTPDTKAPTNAPPSNVGSPNNHAAANGPAPVDASHPPTNAPATNGPAPAANGPAPAANGPAPAANGPAPAPDAGGGGGDSAEPAAADPAAAGGEGGGGGAGGEPIPYWPHLIAPDGEFTMAMKEFTFMRKVAAEFKKGQISAKQKGVDTLATYGKYEEYAEKRKKEAAAHGTESNAAGQVATQNQAAAGDGENQSGKANSEQDKGKGQAGQKAAVDLPEPESHGFWGRIIGRIKRWAKNKAAEIFGWIQEKIADVIMRGLCGVSMADMKSYSGALKNQQARAKGVADTGADTSAQAGAKSEEVKTTAQTETAKAEADIAEADNNIVEADTFLGDINNFEQQLKAEMSNAAAFITTITAEVQAARAKDKEEKAKAAELAKQEAAKAADGGGDAAQSVDNTSADSDGDGQADTSVDPGPQGDNADMSGGDSQGQEEESKESEGEEPDEVNDAIVKEAVTYVGGAGDTAVGQLESKKDDYKNQLKAATTNRDEGLTKQIEPVADEIVTEFKTTLEEMKGHLATIEGSSDAAVDAIISIASDLDKAITTAHSALDEAFTKIYDQIKGSPKKTGAKVVDAINDKAEGVEDKAHAAIDWAEPKADAVWSKGKDAVGAVANPVGDAVENAAVGAVDASARVATGEYGVPMMPY